MTDLEKAARLALEALENPWKAGPNGVADAITALRQALEKPAPIECWPCKGMNCGCTDGVSHSPECQAEHAAAIAGGQFVKDAQQATQEKCKIETVPAQGGLLPPQENS